MSELRRFVASGPEGRVSAVMAGTPPPAAEEGFTGTPDLAYLGERVILPRQVVTYPPFRDGATYALLYHLHPRPDRLEAARHTFDLHPGQVVVLNPGDPWAARNPAAPTPRIRRTILFGTRLMEEAFDDAGRTGSPERLARFASDPVPQPGALVWRLESGFVRLLHADAPPLALEEWMHELVRTLLAAVPHDHHALLRDAPTRLSSHPLDRAMDCLEAHLTDPDLSLTAVAREAGLNKFSLIRAFRAQLRLTPWQFVLKRRVEHARRLLEDPRARVGDVAQECGFDSHAHFTTTFLRLTGVTPQAYRFALR